MHTYLFAGAQGGAGTTFNACATASALSVTMRVLLVDLDQAGDCLPMLGDGANLQDKLDAWYDFDGGTDVLDRYAQQVTPSLSVASRDGRKFSRITLLRALLSDPLKGFDRMVVDWGRCDADDAEQLIEAFAGEISAARLLCLRACYTGARHATTVAHAFTRAAVLVEPGRALTCHDIEIITKLPVTENPYDPQLARAADAGLMNFRRTKTSAFIKEN